MSSNSISSKSKSRKSREELEKIHDECKDGKYKSEEEKAMMVCNVCGMYQKEYESIGQCVRKEKDGLTK